MTHADKLALFAAAAYQALLSRELEVTRAHRRRPGWEQPLARDAWHKSRVLLGAQPGEPKENAGRE